MVYNIWYIPGPQMVSCLPTLMCMCHVDTWSLALGLSVNSRNAPRLCSCRLWIRCPRRNAQSAAAVHWHAFPAISPKGLSRRQIQKKGPIASCTYVVYVHVYMCMSVRIRTHISIYTCICTCMHAYIHTFNTSVYVYVYIYIRVNIHVYVCMYIYIYIDLFMCVYIHTRM